MPPHGTVDADDADQGALVAKGSAAAIERLLSAEYPTYRHRYTSRDLSLYALGLGCGAADLRYVYELHGRFEALPTFLAVAAHPALYSVDLGASIPGCDPAKGVHAEHYIELSGSPSAATRAPDDPSGREVVTRAEVVDAQSKSKGAVVVTRTETRDASLGHLLAVNEFTSFVLGARPFKGAPRPKPRPRAAVAPNAPPARAPDFVADVPTSHDQAALYRLSGDLNPLHIDPGVAAHVGFDRPILHGLCTMGASVLAVLRAYGGGDPSGVRSAKVRFSNHVFPGELLRVSMWADVREGRVVFETRVVGRRGAPAISGAAVVFQEGRMSTSAAAAAAAQGGRGGGGGGAGGVASKL